MSKPTAWIEITKGCRLPKVEIPVLLINHADIRFIGYREYSVVSKESFWYNFYGDRMLRDITHWMPIPKPPKRDKK